MARERFLIASNLLDDLRSQPLLGAFVGLASAALMGLVVAVLHALAQQYATQILDWIARWNAVFWLAIFLLCLGVQHSGWRRDWFDGRRGWLAALPQMPDAMQAWSRARLLVWTLLQVAALLLFLLALNRLAPGHERSAGWLDPALAIVIPLLAWVLMLRFGARRSQLPQGSVATSAAGAVAIDSPAGKGPVIPQWQLRQYRQDRWAPGVRWSLGLIAVLIPAGMAVVQIIAAFLIFFAIIQWTQLWSAGNRVIVEASALTRALPVQRRHFLMSLARVPLLSVAGLLPFVMLVLLAIGVPTLGATLTTLVAIAVLVLHLASVLAWRHQPETVTWRSRLVLLVFALLATATPFLTPLIWTVLMLSLGWRIRRLSE